MKLVLRMWQLWMVMTYCSLWKYTILDVLLVKIFCVQRAIPIALTSYTCANQKEIGCDYQSKNKNYRLLIDAELEVDSKTTLIVGRNNTAKTSCFECIGKVLDGTPFSFNDYPLSKRENLYANIASFMAKEIAFEDLCERLEPISIEFLVDYSLDDRRIT